MITATISASVPCGFLSSARIARITASCVASSKSLYSLHFMVNAFGGAGTSGTSVPPGIGKPGIWGRPGMFGKPGIFGNPGSSADGVREGEAIGGPGSVVIATVPGVVRAQPAAMPAKISAAAATRRWVLICATIGARAT